MVDKPQQQPQREHHFFVSTAKFLFHHPQHGIVAVRDPIRLADAKRRELDPIILYGVTVAGLPIRWLTFSTVGQRKSLCEVLWTAWKDAEGLRGLPDVLRVNRYMAQADPGLAADLATIGVRLEVADTKDKTAPASLRSAHDDSRWLSQRHDPVDLSLAACVEALCLDAQDAHNRSAHRGPRGLSNRKLEDSIEQWLSLPMRQPPSVPLEDRDWEAGRWLSSWETALPPDQPRYFHYDGMSRRTWLISGEEPSDDDDDDDYEFPAYEEHDNTAEIARNLVACWPNPPKDVAAAAGITLRQLQWFTSERATLDKSTHYDLRHLLGIEYDERMGGYTPAGPYVLIARKAQAIEAIYQEISGGGDACPCELVPAQGQADPSWRYVLINAHSTPPTIVMAPRGEVITERLPDLILNYEGIRPVSQALYRDVVTTCARACQTPQANVREMTEFAKRYERYWIDCAWLPD
ncbi:hypothetical protein JET14_21715 (plasmid) [Martelella lutilitoris]|uniref:Uncharacterized protein n=1 Tax=Martelella lutilitoris TaxID=2583532 RepID=A0A7T7KNP5_9HYPH|nr:MULTISPECIES: hypothetical protein [Martelella]AMM87355.1 hypothetical protein AZF01_22725 [Martelella sp. AD-3]QQM33077.1 hypothetical protein JET14_21715 [Martelella lutilitoris]QRX65226.1 hypothetical protein JS578_14390 [Dysgonomonadaceae bacterium zrk40]|tara:strand:+ start:1627 stop:3018 length:1392 start_codon:yes stop_codon:yes gene_type:complete